MVNADEELLELAEQIVQAKANLAKLHSEWAARLNSIRSDATRQTPSVSKVTEHNETNEEAGDNNPTLVLNFLARYPEKAFTPEDVAEGIGRADRVSSIRTTMLRLYSTTQIAKLGRGLYKHLERGPNS